MPKYSKKDSEVFDFKESPLLNFKLDRKKLQAVFNDKKK